MYFGTNTNLQIDFALALNTDNTSKQTTSSQSGEKIDHIIFTRGVIEVYTTSNAILLIRPTWLSCRGHQE